MRYIVKHRRGTSSQIKAAKKPIEDGELVIEYSNDYSVARILIGTKFGYDALQFSAISKIRTVSLPVWAWSGGSGTWSQVVTIDGATTKSKIKLQPTESQTTSLQDSGTSLVAENNAGIITIYARGSKPTISLEMTVELTETSE